MLLAMLAGTSESVILLLLAHANEGGLKVTQGQMHDHCRTRQSESRQSNMSQRSFSCLSVSVSGSFLLRRLHCIQPDGNPRSPLITSIAYQRTTIARTFPRNCLTRGPIIKIPSRHFVQQATSEKKRGAGNNRRARASTSASHSSQPTYAAAMIIAFILMQCT